MDNSLIEFSGVAMPDELIENINRYLSLPDQFAFSRASRSLYKLQFFERSFEVAAMQAKQLKTLVLHGKEDEACSLIQALPHLFFIQTDPVYDLARDHLGNQRTVLGSPFQAALAMGYTQLLNSNIVQEIVKAYPKEVANQSKKQFPNGFDFPIANEKKIDQAFGALAKAINHCKFPGGFADKRTLTSLQIFKNVLKLTTVAEGWLFDFRILLKAIDVFERSWYNWCVRSQRDWYAFNVFGYLQTLVSAFDAQIIIGGITNVMKAGELGLVPQTLNLANGQPYYPDPQLDNGNANMTCFIGGRGDDSQSYIELPLLKNIIARIYTLKASALVQFNPQHQKAHMQSAESTHRCLIS